MTLVELLVFMTIALSFMGGLLPLLHQAARLDAASEEKMAAFFSCQSVIEELRSIDFEDLVAPGSNFHKRGDVYERETNQVPFHTLGGIKHTELKAQELVTLKFGSTGDSSNCYATVELEWNSNRGNKKDPAMKASLSAILYP